MQTAGKPPSNRIAENRISELEADVARLRADNERLTERGMEIEAWCNQLRAEIEQLRAMPEAVRVTTTVPIYCAGCGQQIKQPGLYVNYSGIRYHFDCSPSRHSEQAYRIFQVLYLAASGDREPLLAVLAKFRGELMDYGWRKEHGPVASLYAIPRDVVPSAKAPVTEAPAAPAPTPTPASPVNDV